MANTTMIKIEGGNHCYFGYYGDQKGDNAATITREAQHAQSVAAITAFLH
jgi:hypothetical protein